MLVVKPQTPIINWGHPITKGLVFNAPLFEGGGTIINDVVSKSQGVLTTATWDVNKYGKELDYSTAGSNVLFSNLPSNAQSLIQMSIEILAFPRTSGGAGFSQYIIKESNSQNRFQILFNGNAVDIRFQVFYNTTKGNWVWSGVISLPNWYHIIITYDGSSLSNVPTLYLNGKLKTPNNSTQPQGTWNTDGSRIRIGNDSTGGLTFDGKIVYTRMWNRVLLAKEAINLYQNPWQIYKTSNYKNRWNTVTAGLYNTLRGLMGMGI